MTDAVRAAVVSNRATDKHGRQWCRRYRAFISDQIASHSIRGWPCRWHLWRRRIARLASLRGPVVVGSLEDASSSIDEPKKLDSTKNTQRRACDLPVADLLGGQSAERVKVSPDCKPPPRSGFSTYVWLHISLFWESEG